jgi:hypothetical protein
MAILTQIAPSPMVTEVPGCHAEAMTGSRKPRNQPWSRSCLGAIPITTSGTFARRAFPTNGIYSRRRNCSSVLEAQEYLGVVVQNFVDVCARQAGLSDVVKRLSVGLKGEQNRVVAPCHEVVGAERLPGAE